MQDGSERTKTRKPVLLGDAKRFWGSDADTRTADFLEFPVFAPLPDAG